MIEETEPSDFTPRFEVVSCFVEWKENLLLLQRQSYKPQPNTWGVPAGKMKKDENRFQAMKRELREETGLKSPASTFDFLDKVFVRYPDYDFIYHIFRLKRKKKPEIEINEEEHQDYSWVTPRAASDLNLIRDLDACIELIYQERNS